MRIVIPLWEQYYLFDYLRHLVPRLIAAGHQVTLVTFQAGVRKAFSELEPAPLHEDGPFLLKAARHLESRRTPIFRGFFRIIHWLVSWWWARSASRRFDLAIVPWDNKPSWYALVRWLPAVTCHNTTEMIELQNTLDRDQVVLSSVWKRMAHRVYRLVDSLMGGRFLPRLAGRELRYDPLFLLVDRLMGWRAPNLHLGYGGVRLLTVTGEAIRDSYVEAGFPAERIAVVGHPGYDSLLAMEESFDSSQRQQLRNELGVAADSRILTLFLSPTNFTDAQVREVLLVVERIRARIDGAFVVLKFHPKTPQEEADRIGELAGGIGQDLAVITRFGGDEENTQLILVSEAIVQKQSTVGFIAMLHQRPILSYDLVETGYEDHMYKILDASVHAASEDQFDAALDSLSDGEAMEELGNRQELACRRFCLRTSDACGRVASLVDEIGQGG